MFKKIKNLNLLEPALIIISLFSFFGALVYKIYSLNLFGLILAIILTTLSFYIIQKISGKNNGTKRGKGLGKIKKSFWLYPYAAALSACLAILISSRSDRAIVSPWETVPGLFFLFYLLAVVFFLLLARSSSGAGIAKIHYFLVFSIALIVYKIGYGFDPFIHQATADLIAKTGAVDPKPFYYLGQYSLEIFLNKIFFLPIAWADKILVPLLAAFSLPFVFSSIARRLGLSRSAALAAPLLAPWPLFIFTAPQNLAFIFLFLALSSWPAANRNDLIKMLVFALAAMAVHPLAGLPALTLFLFSFISYQPKKSWKKYALITAFIIMSSAIPLAFIFSNSQGSLSGEIAPAVSPPAWPEKENFLLNALYLYGFNFKYLLLAAFLGGLVITIKARKIKILFPLFLSAACLLVSAAWIKNFSFDYLIAYERNDFFWRTITAAAILLSPLGLMAAQWMKERILKQEKKAIAVWIIFFATAAAAALYHSYPRFDNYYNSRGYSVSQSDLEAVRWINKRAGDKDYLVLANQQTSAAALREFGFKKYFKNDIFYYPIPTGGELYPFYLKMVYEKANAETMLLAMNLAEVEESYFAVSGYWWAAPKIIAEAKTSASEWKSINNEVFIFRYLRQ